MRMCLGVSLFALLAATTAPAGAAEWFRLNMSPIAFAADEDADGPPVGGVNDSIRIEVDQRVDERRYGDMVVPVTATGIDATYTVAATNLPSGATWNSDPEVFGAGTIVWNSASQGSYSPTVEVRDVNGVLVASADLEIVVHPPLDASVAQPAYETTVGEELNIAPTVTELISAGSVQWGFAPSPLPEWLSIDASTGRIEVETSAPNEIAEVVLTAVDQVDLASASTLPFSISVLGAPTEYWVSTFGGTSSDPGYGIVSGPDGSTYVVGLTLSPPVSGSADLFIAKYSSAGDLDWKSTLVGVSSDYGISVASGPDGALYVAGYTTSTGAGNNDALITKFDASGNVDWRRVLGGTLVDYAQGIDVAADGSVYITGYTNSAGAGNTDVLVAKYTSSGNLVWSGTIGGSGIEYGEKIAVGPDGSLYLVAATRSAGAGGYDLLVAKYSATGIRDWWSTLGSVGAEHGYGVDVADDGAIYVAGTTALGAGGGDMLIAKFSSSGSLAWKKTLGGTSPDEAHDLKVGSDGGIYVVGHTMSAGAGGSDIVVAKYSSSGEIAWQRTLGGAGSDYGFGVSSNGAGDLNLIGYTSTGGAGGNDAIVASVPLDGGEGMVAGDFTWQAATMTVGGSPALASSFNPSSVSVANNPISIVGASATTLVQGSGSGLTSTTTPLIVE